MGEVRRRSAFGPFLEQPRQQQTEGRLPRTVRPRHPERTLRGPFPETTQHPTKAVPNRRREHIAFQRLRIFQVAENVNRPHISPADSDAFRDQFLRHATSSRRSFTSPSPTMSMPPAPSLRISIPDIPHSSSRHASRDPSSSL